MIPIQVNNRNYQENNVWMIKFSPDCALSAVVFGKEDGTGELFLYRHYDKNLSEIVPGK
jgi:hypothetical protein